MSQQDDYEQFDEGYYQDEHDHFDEYDYHEEGADEDSSLLPLLAIGLLLSNRSRDNDNGQDPFTTFLFFMFLPITFPFLLIKEMLSMVFNIIAFMFKGVFSLIEFIFQSIAVDELKKNDRAKQATNSNKANSNKAKNDANHIVINNQQANNYFPKRAKTVVKNAKSKAATKSTAQSNAESIDTIEEINRQIQTLEQHKQQLKQQAVNRVKSRDLDKADRGHYYENNDANVKQNASKLAEQATITYI